MQRFISTCLVACAAQASFQTYNVLENGTVIEKQIRRANGGDQPVVSYENWQVNLPASTSLVIQDMAAVGYDYAYMPALRGGSINFWVYMGELESGCVAGLYLVTLSEACDAEAAQSRDPQCPTIEVMETNPYGFQS